MRNVIKVVGKLVKSVIGIYTHDPYRKLINININPGFSIFTHIFYICCNFFTLKAYAYGAAGKETGDAVLFLMTTPFATGSTVRVDGGGVIG